MAQKCKRVHCVIHHMIAILNGFHLAREYNVWFTNSLMCYIYRARFLRPGITHGRSTFDRTLTVPKSIAHTVAAESLYGRSTLKCFSGLTIATAICFIHQHSQSEKSGCVSSRIIVHTVILLCPVVRILSVPRNRASSFHSIDIRNKAWPRRKALMYAVLIYHRVL